ncbi:protein translocase subunit SecF [Limnochorda pilosa]|uniref:Protein-export membrane protein SecF n=1 Tax=Limnochorda pilosa TaxID=1555112 RepID=A0A0K2SN88_LIMPI|nr:protein translocase subunit SecF [Limnochorda pilosa]BAS28467.1 preprotein translocase subunit SecF [Limnochorda pilosa]
MTFDVMGRRRVFFLISGLLVLASAVLLATRGLNLGIDFTQGTLMERGFERVVSETELRQALADPALQNVNLGTPRVQHLGDGRQVLIRVPALSNEAIATIDRVLGERFGPVEVLRTEVVHPVIGAELLRRALLSLGLAAVGVLVYVSIRFEYSFGLMAIVADLHDALIALGVLSLLGWEVNTAFIAAILTVVGYSINDTIVVYDKIREVRSAHPRLSPAEAANRGVQETFVRSINTSLTTLVAVAVLVALGGETLRVFSVTLLVGILVGTYSSIFVASPLWVSWTEWLHRRSTRVRQASAS